MITGTLISASLLMHMMLSAPLPASTGWKTVAASGRVETHLQPAAGPATDTVWQPVRRGDIVAAASHLRTWEKARATLTRQGDLILVDAGTEIVLPEMAAGAGTVVMQTSGNAVYKVAPRQPGARFEVKTPFLVAGVKGTRFSVQIEGDRAAVSVVEGVVEVRSLLTGQVQDLSAGESAIVDGHEGRMELQRDEAPQREPREKTSLSDAALGFDDVATTTDRLDRSLSTDIALVDEVDKAVNDLWSDLMTDLSLRDLLGREDTKSSAGTTGTTATTEEKNEDKTLLELLPLLPRRP
ncbi:MAG: FecR domain-containing protein [Candidatus Polarisedimenticolia bacterium]